MNKTQLLHLVFLASCWAIHKRTRSEDYLMAATFILSHGPALLDFISTSAMSFRRQRGMLHELLWLTPISWSAFSGLVLQERPWSCSLTPIFRILAGVLNPFIRNMPSWFLWPCLYAAAADRRRPVEQTLNTTELPSGVLILSQLTSFGIKSGLYRRPQGSIMPADDPPGDDAVLGGFPPPTGTHRYDHPTPAPRRPLGGPVRLCLYTGGWCLNPGAGVA